MKKIITLIFLLSCLVGFSQSSTIVISQFYGAGGNSGAVLNADYVELHNIAATPQSLNGLSLQYESASPSGTWNTTIAILPNVNIPAGGYYLVQMSNVGANGAALPTPDFTANVAMGGTNGIVALVAGTTVISGCPTSGIIDLVGYGTATCFEGSGATPAVSSTLAGFRANNGCTDTDNNSADFTTATPAPRNSASPISSCAALPPALTISGSISDFGNIVVGNSSTSQSYSISGSNLTGAPGNITITAPTHFEVSNNNSTWGSSTTIAYSSATLAATNVYVRFTPTAAGPASGNVSNSGGGVTVPLTVAVSGTGLAPSTPVLSAGTLASFGNVCINATAGPQSFTVTGINLTNANVTVGPLTGYQFATTAAGPYTANLNLSQAGGAYSQEIFVQFTPTQVQSYNGNITIGGGGATAIDVAATGAGANNPASITTGASSAVTISGATLAGNISDIGCSAITAYGIEYSTTNNFPNGSGTMVAASNLISGDFSATLSGLQPATTYYYKAYATNAAGTAYGLQRSFVTATPVITATALTAFGSHCVGSTQGPNSFAISSTALGVSDVTVGPLAGYSFALSASGTYSNSLSISQPGGAFAQTIFVKFSPTAVQSYNGNIPVAGGGANTIPVPASGAGVNLPPTLSTGAASQITTLTATLEGTMLTTGCSNVTAYGIEYSGIAGFAEGTGTKVWSNNANSSGTYTVGLQQLVQGATYYYRALATNAGGTGYGNVQSFTAASIPNTLTLYNIPVRRNNSMRYSINNITPDHYAVLLYNSTGQLVHRKDIIVQVNFMNEYLHIPGHLTPGLYKFKLENYNGFSTSKTILIK